jgi:uncharacterized protein
MKKIFFLYICFFTFPLVAQKITLPEAFSYDAGALIGKGIELYEADKLDSALIYFDRVLKDDPDYLYACYEKMLVYDKQKKRTELIAFVKQELKAEQLSEFPRIYVIYGSALDDEKKYSQADSVFQLAQKYMPNNSNLLFNHALVKINQNKNQEAIDLLKKTIDLDPANASALYFLGLLAFDNGLLSQGCLAMLASITISPEGRYSSEAIMKLNAKMAQNFDNKKSSVFSSQGDDFSELEEILKNQLPLNPKYKLKCDIDDVATRNIQAICEYSKTHQVKSGYFEQKFIPFIAKIEQLGFTEYFTYYCLLGLNKDSKVGKKVSKHSSEINTFTNEYIKKEYWDLFAKRKNIYGINDEVVVFYENGRPALVGTYKNGMRQGAAVELNRIGDIIVKSFYKDDKLEGLAISFDDKGQKTEETSFKNGLKDGENIYYFSNGNIKYKQNYLNDELEGTYQSFFPNGSKYGEGNFVKGLVQNKFKNYYENGVLNSEQNYKDGLLVGKSVIYNIVGDIVSTANYVNGKLEGEVIDYFDGKKLKVKSFYTNDVIQSSTSYFPNGKISEEFKKGLRTYYNQLGNKVSEEFYSNDFEVEKSITYDHEGKIIHSVEYGTNGELKSFKQYSNTSDKPIESKVNMGKVIFRQRNGIKASEGLYFKKLRDKQWIYYNENGKVASKVNYDKGVLSGLSIFYDRYGNIETVYNNINNNVAGPSYNYLRNQKLSTYHYNEGSLNGPFENFKNEKLISKGLYENGELAYQEEYNLQGSMTTSAKYIGGHMIERKIYDEMGKESFNHNMNNFTGKLNYNQHLYYYEEHYKSGILDGPFSIRDKSGALVKETNYVNEKEHGKSIFYNLNGSIAYESNYYAGNQNGEAKSYDLAGKLKSTYLFYFDDDSGISQRYYQSGKLLAEYSDIKDVFYGQNKYYNEDGDLVLKLNFANNFVTSYACLENGVMKESAPIDTNKVSITSTLANGTIVCNVDIKNMEINGKFIINGQDGKPDYDADFLNGKLHGKRLEYYKNNKLYRSDSFNFEKNDGLTEYFSEDGSPLISVNYVNDSYQGDYILYKNGKKMKTMTFENNSLISIINH